MLDSALQRFAVLHPPAVRKHRNVILRHNDLRRAHVGKPFFRAEVTVILGSIPDLAAAGYDEPRQPRATQLRFQKSDSRSHRPARP